MQDPVAIASGNTVRADNWTDSGLKYSLHGDNTVAEFVIVGMPGGDVREVQVKLVNSIVYLLIKGKPYAIADLSLKDADDIIWNDVRNLIPKISE